VGRPSWRSSFLGDRGGKFLCGKLGIGTKKEKRPVGIVGGNKSFTGGTNGSEERMQEAPHGQNGVQGSEQCISGGGLPTDAQTPTHTRSALDMPLKFYISYTLTLRIPQGSGQKRPTDVAPVDAILPAGLLPKPILVQ
jgi:hypothetical protein